MESLFFNKRGQQLGYLLLSAALLTLSFPKTSWSFLAWIAFIPLFKALESQPARKRLALGYTMGFIYSLGVFYWVTHSMRYYGHLSVPISISMLVLLALYLALFPAVFGLLWGLFPAGGLFSLIWAPALWVGLEYLRVGPALRFSLGLGRLQPVFLHSPLFRSLNTPESMGFLF